MGDSCGSQRSECLVITPVCLIGMSRSGSDTFSLKSLLFLVEVSRLGCLLGGIDTVLVTGLSPNLCLSAWLDPPVWHCLVAVVFHSYSQWLLGSRSLLVVCFTSTKSPRGPPWNEGHRPKVCHETSVLEVPAQEQH